MHAMMIPADGGKPFHLEKAVTLIGRRQFVCDYYLDDRRISKLHCLIIRLPEGYLIRDLGSANGTRLNGQRVTEAELSDGDEISIEKQSFQFRTAKHHSVAAPDRLAQGELVDGVQAKARRVPDEPVVVRRRDIQSSEKAAMTARERRRLRPDGRDSTSDSSEIFLSDSDVSVA